MNLDTLETRPLRIVDKDQIKELDKENPGKIIFSDIEHVINATNNTGEDQDVAFGIFDENDKLFGYFIFEPASTYVKEAKDEDLYLSSVYVRDNYKNQGIGKKLITETLLEQFNRGVWLKTANEDLIKFFEKLGFFLMDKDVGLMFYAD